MNLLHFLRLLRQKLGDSYWLSADVSPSGLYGPDGKTVLTDYSAFGKVVDAFNILVSAPHVGCWRILPLLVSRLTPPVFPRDP